jgi:hypothetical protein
MKNSPKVLTYIHRRPEQPKQKTRQLTAWPSHCQNLDIERRNAVLDEARALIREVFALGEGRLADAEVERILADSRGFRLTWLSRLRGGLGFADGLGGALRLTHFILLF